VVSDVPLRGENMTTVGEFDVAAGQELCFTMTWHPSHLKSREPHALDLMKRAETEWRAWAAQCTYEGEWRPQVLRSLITLKALTHSATGGIVAAATTSLPEAIGGVRNWDYRYCWARDATFTLLAMVRNGFLDEARAWREWLLRAVAGDPSQLQIMYAVDGERRLTEMTLPWLPGFEGRARCASATPPTRSASSTSTARSSTPSTRPASTGSRRTATRGTYGASCSSSWRRAGISRTKASGRCAVRGDSSRTPR
jgi:hypothetical protein